MRILLVINSLYGGGAERAMAQLANVLAPRHEVHLVLTRQLRKERHHLVDEVTVHELNLPEPHGRYSGVYAQLQRIMKLRKLKRELETECSVSFLAQPNYENALSRVNDRIVISVRNRQMMDMFQGLRRKLYAYEMRSAPRHSDAVVCVSRDIVPDQMEQFGVDREKLVVVNNSCDADHLAAEAVAPLEDPEFEEFIRDAGPVFVTMGRLTYQKGQWHLIKAFNEALKKLPNAKLVILGRGWIQEDLEGLANQLGIADRVLFAGYKDSPFRYLGHCDVFVFPSLFEGFSNAVLEAMACGLPVIAADYIGGARELLAPGTGAAETATDVEFQEFGVIVPIQSGEYSPEPGKFYDSAQKLADALVAVGSDKELQERYACKSRERVKDFSLNRFANGWERVIRGGVELTDLARGVVDDYVDEGFSANSVNVAAFRKGSLATHVEPDGSCWQVCAYYAPDGSVMLAKRAYEGIWQRFDTGFDGIPGDAHNTINVAIDGHGFIHMAWSRHKGEIFYLRSTEPGGTQMERQPMLGDTEGSVTYPEFYLQPSGDLLMLYRDGRSGNGDVLLNRYRVGEARWERVCDCLVSGQGQRSAYWQASVDGQGRLHLSWTWRETHDVSTNHDICYLRSTDATCTRFVDASGYEVELPVTLDSIAPVVEVPQGSMLMNQTSMCVNEGGVPFVASYWRVGEAVQYVVATPYSGAWQAHSLGLRSTDFSLEGQGTKLAPIARPQVLAGRDGDDGQTLYLLIRDEERAAGASLVTASIARDGAVRTEVRDLVGDALGAWEPTYDLELWGARKELQVFVQPVAHMHDNASMRTSSASSIHTIRVVL